jgi:hypothetical protein
MKKMVIGMTAVLFALSVSFVAFADEPKKGPASKPIEDNLIPPHKEPKKTVEHEVKEAVDKHKKKDAEKKAKKKAKKEKDQKGDNKEDQKDK